MAASTAEISVGKKANYYHTSVYYLFVVLAHVY
jgi:hypothetical protein